MSEPQQRYCIDVFGRYVVNGLLDFSCLERLVMPDDEMQRFLEGAIRIETTDCISGWKVIAYAKDESFLIYDTVSSACDH